MMGFVLLLKLAVKCLGILAWPVFGLGYPLWASVQAIETNSNSETKKLITYWVSISVVLLLEHSFQLEWLTFWSYIKLMIVCCLVLPCFDGSVYVYKHLVHRCLPMSLAIITCQINKKDDFLVEVKSYMKENGSGALEDLIASTKKSAKPDVAVKEIRAVEAEDLLKFGQLPARLEDSNDVEIKEKIEVASTKQLLKLEQPKLPVRFKDGNAEEVTERQEVASTTQACQEESNTSQTEYITFLPLESMHSATTTAGGGDLRGFLPPEEVRKVWTCVICQVTAPSETVLNLHLHGNRHKATCERLNIKNQRDVNSHLQGNTHRKAFEPLNFKNKAPTSNVSPASVGRNQRKSRYIEIIDSHWWCTISNAGSVSGMQSHLKGKRHRATLLAMDGH